MTLVVNLSPELEVQLREKAVTIGIYYSKTSSSNIIIDDNARRSGKFSDRVRHQQIHLVTPAQFI